VTQVVNVRTGDVVLGDLREARGAWQRLVGLMFTRSLPAAAGVLFRPARGVHTHFMRFAIDLIYLDERDRVCAIRPNMPPWRLDLRAAAAVIEANAGLARDAGIQLGDQLRLIPPLARPGSETPGLRNHRR
jgi:uncharacterized membrane protein (UPF0127 family)